MHLIARQLLKQSSIRDKLFENLNGVRDTIFRRGRLRLRFRIVFQSLLPVTLEIKVTRNAWLLEQIALSRGREERIPAGRNWGPTSQHLLYFS